MSLLIVTIGNYTTQLLQLRRNYPFSCALVGSPATGLGTKEPRREDEDGGQKGETGTTTVWSTERVTHPRVLAAVNVTHVGRAIYAVSRRRG